MSFSVFTLLRMVLYFHEDACRLLSLNTEVLNSKPVALRSTCHADIATVINFPGDICVSGNRGRQ